MAGKQKGTLSFRSKCFYIGVLLAALLAIIFNDKLAFLFVINSLYKLLNFLDGTSLDKTWNAYSGTAASEFLKPLKEDEISEIYYNMKPKSGEIPVAFNDAILFRIGSNQYYRSRSNIHILEGDAMLHSFKFNSNTNTLSISSAFMETPKLKIEKKWNQGIYEVGTEDLLMALNTDKDISDLNGLQKTIKRIKFFLGRFIDNHFLSPFNKDILSDDDNRYFHCANRDILSWNNKLYATCERSVFFEFSVDPETLKIESIGFTNLNESWNKYPFIAHPRIDKWNNDNLMVIGHDIQLGNGLGVGIFDRNYNLLNKAEIALNHAQEVHDMAATQNYIVIFDYNIWFGQDLMDKYGTLFKFEYNTSSSSRIGIIDKNKFINGVDRVQWFNIKPCIVFHIANAWEEEEGDIIKLIGGRQNKFDFNGILHFDVVNKKRGYNKPTMYEWKLNIKTGVVEERMINEKRTDVEMPIIHPLFEGRKTKYIWFNLIDFSDDGFAASSYGIIKYDVEKDEIVGDIKYEGNGKYGSYQAVFVPNERDNINKVMSEDDGYLVNVIWNKTTKKSNLQIFDAKTMHSKPVAIIELPYRIPGGFHSRFIYQ